MLAIAGYDQNRFEINMYVEQDFYVMGAGHYKLIHREDFSTSREDGTKSYQLLYIASGEADFLVQGERHVVRKGGFVLYHPDEKQYYRYEKRKHPDIYWVHFCCSKSNDLLQELRLGDMHIISTKEQELYSRTFESMIQELQWKELFYQQRSQLLMQDLLLRIVRDQRTPKEQQEQNQFIKEAIQIFNKEYHTDIAIKEYTKKRGLNYYHFIDSFSNYTGMPPKQYLIHMRMNRAKELLKVSALSISEIASMVGYENALYFSRLFHKTFGIAPSDYRKQ